MTKYQTAAKKAWVTRRNLYGTTGKAGNTSRSAAAYKAWETRRANERFAKRSAAAKKAWATRRGE